MFNGLSGSLAQCMKSFIRAGWCGLSSINSSSCHISNHHMFSRKSLLRFFFLTWLVRTIPRTTFPPRKTQQKRCDTLFPTLPSFTVNKNQQIVNLIILTSPVRFTQRMSSWLPPGPVIEECPHQTNPGATEDAAKSVAVPEQNGWIWWPKAPEKLQELQFGGSCHVQASLKLCPFKTSYIWGKEVCWDVWYDNYLRSRGPCCGKVTFIAPTFWSSTQRGSCRS